MSLIPGRGIEVRENVLAMPSVGVGGKALYANISAQIGLVAKQSLLTSKCDRKV